ncbi:alpha/beta hydrolase [Streptomyces sp. NPDC055709]
MYSLMDVAWGHGRQEAEDARILAEEEAARRSREEREDAATAGGGVGVGVGAKVTLDFGVGPDGEPRLLEVVNLGGGICCTGMDVLDVLRAVGIDAAGGKRGIRTYARREKQRAERTDPRAEEKRARQSADREDFPRYVEGLLKLLAVQPSGKSGWGAPFESGSTLVSSVEKLVPIPRGWVTADMDNWDQYSRDAESDRSRQILEKVDPSSPTGASDSGLRIIIANAGRNASRRDVFPGASEEAQDGSGTWAVLSVPHGVIEEREDKLQRPDVMLGYQLAMATHVLSGSWNPSKKYLKVVNSLTNATSFEMATAPLTEWAALGNETALRDYLKKAGQDPEAPLPPVRHAAVTADDFAHSLSEAIEEGILDEEAWRPALSLADTRALAASITLRKLAKERDLPVLNSPEGGGSKSALWAQHELNVDPREITSAMAKNPNTTVKQSTPALGQGRILWGGMSKTAKFLGTLNNPVTVATSALEDRTRSEAARTVARLLLSALTGPVNLTVCGITVACRTSVYLASRLEAGGRNLEATQKNIERAIEHPLVAVEGVGGFLASTAKSMAPLIKEALSELIPGAGQVGEIVVDVASKAAHTATDISALRAAAEAINSKKALQALDRLEEIANEIQRYRRQHLGVSGASDPAALYRGGSLDAWDEEEHQHALRRWDARENLLDKPGELDGIEQERVATPAGDKFEAVHKDNWSRCVSDWTSPNKEKQKTANFVMESVREIGGSISMEATGGEGTLLAYDPDFGDGQGRAALAVGDMTTAEYVAILVPGMTSSLESLPELARRARGLRDQCLRTRPGARVATVAWIGYKAPGVELGVLTEGPAEKGAELLRNDLETWRLYWQRSAVRRSRNLPAQPLLTVSGMSYGSLVAGHASIGGAAPDNLVFLGSPGTGLRAQHLGTPSSNIFVAANNWDPVSVSDWFSIDPAHEKYGDITRMKTDEGVYNPYKAHTNYYDLGTESLANVSRVVVGKPEEVTRDEQRTRVVGGGYRNMAGRAFTDSPEKSTVKSRRKRAAEEADPAPSPSITSCPYSRGFPVLRSSGSGSPTVRLDKRMLASGKLFAAYGVGFFIPDFMEIVTENGSIELDTTWPLQPKGFRKDRVFIVEMNPDGSTDCYERRLGDEHDDTDTKSPYTGGKRQSFGLPEAGKIIVVALIPHESTEVWMATPSGMNRIKRSDVDVPDPFPLPLEAPTTDLQLLKRIIKVQLSPLPHDVDPKKAPPELQIPAAAQKHVVDAVRDYFASHPEQQREQGPNYWELMNNDYSDMTAWLAIRLANRMNLFGTGPSVPNPLAETLKWTNSGEVYLIDAAMGPGMPEGMHGSGEFKVEAKPGPGRFFALDEISSLSLPPWCDFRWIPTGGEVRCAPPLSTAGDRLPLLALYDMIDGGLIDVISMDNEWHRIPLDITSKSPCIIIGAIVTSRSEKRALPSGAEGRKLDPYPLDILTVEVDELNITEKWFAKLEQEGGEAPVSFDWRGLARSTDPWLGILKEMKIPEGSMPVARVMLKSMLETTEHTPLADKAKRVMTAGDEYIGAINRIRPFHRHTYPDKYSGGRIPLDTEVVADFARMNPKAWTVSYRDAWKRARKAVRTAEKKFNSEVADLNRELKAGAKNASVRTDPISVPKSPSMALRSAFLILSAANLGVSLYSGTAEGNTLAHAVAAGSSISVAMPVLQQSLSMFGKAKAAGMVGNATPFVSLLANALSLANNLNQADIDEWAVAFDVMSIAADLLAILAIKFSALGPVATPLGLVVAAACVAYIVTHWGATLPLPDEFVKDLGGKLVHEVESSLDTSRVDLHQRLESIGVPYHRIAALWNTCEQSSTSKVILEQLGRGMESSPIISDSNRISMASRDDVHKEVEHLLEYSTPLRVPSMDVVRQLYVELTKYCVKKIVDRIEDTSPGERMDLRGLSFSLKDWESTDEAIPWIDKYRNDMRSYF